MHLFTNKRILIIDDDPFNCEAMRSIMKVLRLRNIDSIVDVVYSGAEALDFIK